MNVTKFVDRESFFPLVAAVVIAVGIDAFIAREQRSATNREIEQTASGIQSQIDNIHRRLNAAGVDPLDDGT